MDDIVKLELDKALQSIVNRLTGESKDKAALIVVDINTVIGSMISDPDNAFRHEQNLKILYGNLSTLAAIETKEVRKLVATTVTNVLNRSLTLLVLSL